MGLVHRVLYPDAIASLDDYLAHIGAGGLEAARSRPAEAIIAEVEASGLRGRGGAGFPTGRKWRTVAAYRAADLPTTVVVNGAEGEPGTFKDRTILRNDPYRVIEGALIAARAVDAPLVVFALKRRFGPEVARLQRAIDEFAAAGLTGDVELRVFQGPDEYLYGEETAMLEVLDGRAPLPRLAPPFRHGVIEVVDHADDVDTGLTAHREMAATGGESDAPPTLVDNIETIANVARIIERGADWFRTEGTPDSPGTIVCTVTGDTRHAGVGEVPMGTPLREVIELIGGGPRAGRTIKAVLPGVAQGFIPADALDTPVSYEAMTAIGRGLGSGGFIVFDDQADLVAVTAGVSRFLAVESCGQCTPCKGDGLELADALARLCGEQGGDHDVAEIRKRAGTVADRSRCYLAQQHQNVVAGLLEHFGDELQARVDHAVDPVAPALITELVDIDAGRAEIDVARRDKQPDWTFGDEWSGKWPAELLAEHRAPHEIEG